MVDDENKKKDQDDFFSLIEKDQEIENPFATDEILFRDASGQLKILKGGEVLDSDQQLTREKTVVGPAPAAAVKVKTSALPVAEPLNIDREVETIIKKSGIHFSDQEIAKRFENIIISRLKDIRDQVQTREVLLSSSLVGGMGFSAQDADRVLKVIGEEFERLDGKLRERVSQEPFSDLRAEAEKILEEPLASSLPVLFESESDRDKAPSAEAVTVQPKPSVSAKKPQPLPAVSQEEIKEGEPARVEPTSISRPMVSQTGGKPKIEDVKFQPKLTSPIEEIRSMTLTDFRRLASTPTEVIEKILEKIEILEEESFVKKTQAIKAWKENDIHQLYLELGDRSMEEKKPIAEIIAERQKANQPTLTAEELEAVIELNQKLRY